MKSFVIAALLGLLSINDVQSIQIKNTISGPPSNASEQAAAAAAKAGNVDPEAANNAVIKAQADAERIENQKTQAAQEARRDAVEKRINAEAEQSVAAAAATVVLTPEQKAAILSAKITAEIKARKEQNAAIIAAAKAKQEADAAEDEARFKKQANEREAFTASLLREAGVKKEASLGQQVNEILDQDLIGVEDVLDQDNQIEDKSDQEFDEEYDEGDENDDDEVSDEDAQMGDEDIPELPMTPDTQFNLAQQKIRARKGKDAHLHETDMRVDPPLLDDGKKSIAEAEKSLEDAKEDYDKKKKKSEEKELAFHAASRVSKAARESRAKAEDRYYISAKAARKAMRYAENMEREAKFAAARQAAHDKYNEVIATANHQASLVDAGKATAKSYTVKLLASNSTMVNMANSTIAAGNQTLAATPAQK